jgi:uncharacterized protein YdgA (DUF945 family)
MKKAIVVLALIVVVVLAVTPFVGGVIMEKTVNKVLEDANTMSAEYAMGYSYEVLNYERGYSTTDFEWKIDLGELKHVYGIESIIITEHARHGFSGIESTMSLEKNPWFTDFIDNKLEGQNPFHITTSYSFLGGIESTIACESFSFLLEGETLDVKQSEIKVSTNRALEDYSVSGTMGGMMAAEVITIGEMSIESDLQKLSTFIWEGEMAFGIENIKVVDSNEEAELKDLEFAYSVEADKGANTIDYSMLFTLDSLQVEDQDISDGSLRFSVNGINMDAYEEFMESYMQLYAQMIGDVYGQNEYAMSQNMSQFKMEMMGIYEKMLKKDLELQISDLHFKHNTGKVDGDVTLRLLKDMTLAQFATVAFQPQSLLDIFHLESNVSLPAELIGEEPEMLNPLFPGMQTGIFIKDGDMLVHEAETKDGTLFLNGKELNLGG